MKKSGFTLIEVLIYTALIGVAGVFLNSTLISVLRLQGQQSASTVVNQQIDFVLQNIKRSVLESSLIEMEGNIASTTLTLRMTDEALDPTLIYLSGTTVYIKKGAAAALALTTADVNADQLDFTKVSSYPGHDSVSVDISFSFNTDNPQQAFTKTINSAISRVSGATFDSDILPGADATYSVGSVANRWQNLTLSGDLTVAGDSSFTGNVGIGTAIPGVNLHVIGPTTVTNSAIRVESGDDSSAIWKSVLDLRHKTDTVIVSGSSVGIGLTPLSSTGSGFFGAVAIKGVRENATANNQDTALSFWTRAGASNSTTDTEKMRITSTGNVGIGTTSPWRALSVTGGAVFTNLDTSTDNTDYKLVVQKTDGALMTDTFLLWNPGGDTLTVGNGGLVLSGSQIRTSGSNPLYLTNADGSSAVLLNANGGKVGIGTTSPSQLLSVAGTIYSSTGGFRFPDGTTQTTAGGGSTVQAPTRQILTSGSGTYTTPSGAGLIKIRMVAGGGGGGGTHSGATAGGTGGTTSFNSVTAIGGGGGAASGTGGDGGTGGTGTASLRIPGGGGDDNSGSAASGGSSPFGGAGRGKIFGSGAGTPASVNSGSGGGGNQCNGCTPAYSSGGGAGEYVELIITNPSATYSYAVGAAGTGGAGTYPGGAGGSGVIIVDEYYTTALSVDVTSGGNNTFTGTNAFTNGITGMWSTVSSQTVSGVSSITFSNLAVATTYRLIATLTPTSSNTAATWYFRINNDSSASYLYGGNYAVSAGATGGLGSLAATGCPFQLSTGTMTAGADVTNLATEPFRSSPANSARQIITYSAGSTYGNEGSIMSEKMTCYAKVGTMTSITIVPPVTASGWVALEKMN